MTETNDRFDSNGTEWFIPPCVAELRAASDDDRVHRNAGQRSSRQSTDFEAIEYSDAGDGEMYVRCLGKGACAGAEVKVDRHDIIHDTLPLSTDALAQYCISRTMYYSQGGFLRKHEATD